MVTAPDNLVGELTIIMAVFVTISNCVDGCFATHQYSIADDEPAYRKDI